MNNALNINLIRFIGLVLVQGLVLQRISVGWSGFYYVNIFLYPLFILLLPIRTNRVAELFLGFGLGLLIDVFYNTLGLHASATLFTAFIRPFVLARLAPRGGYKVNTSPTRMEMGFTWFLQYSSIMMAAHIFYFFSVEAFTFYYILDILGKSFYSFVFSMIFVITFITLFNTKE